MSPSQPPASSPVPPPTWQELTKFIDEQNQKTRNTVDFWFKLAAGLFGFILVAAGYVGWKTVTDAKEAAVRSATETARAAVEKKLTEPAIQQLVHDTAIHMLETGEFNKDIQEEVHTKLPGAVGSEIRKQIPDLVSAKLAELGITPRIISEHLAESYRESLEKGSGKTVVIKARSTDEPTRFAKRLLELLLRAHIKGTLVSVKPGTWDGLDLNNAIEWSNAGSDLADVIATLIKAATGVAPEKSHSTTQAATNAPDVTIMIGEKELLAVPHPPRQ